MLPPEPFTRSSVALAFSSLFLLISVSVLAFASRATRGARDGKPDLCGKRVTMREVSARFRHSYSPGRFLSNPLATHVGPDAPPSHLYSAVWRFLSAWLAASAVYSFFASLILEVEIFREAQLASATISAAVAILLCALWLPLFRYGCYTDEQQAEHVKRVLAAHAEAGAGADGDAPIRPLGTRKWSLPTSLLAILVALIVVVNASAELQAWTLPSEHQIGFLLFFAPGLGIFGGWIVVAFTLSVGTTVSYFSSPDGNLARPTNLTPEERRHLYPPSLLPIVAATLVALYAFVVPDPALPLPLAFMLAFFTPTHTENIVAACIAGAGSLGAAAVVLVARNM